MVRNSKTQLIVDRRAELAAKRQANSADIQRLTAENAALAKEDEELLIAARVLARLEGGEVPELPEMQPAGEGRKPGKPAGIPTVFEMAEEIIRESGATWLEGRIIFDEIKRRWWPTAQSNDIIPTLWRIAGTGKRLKKRDTKYALKIEQHGSGESSSNPKDATSRQA